MAGSRADGKTFVGPGVGLVLGSGMVCNSVRERILSSGNVIKIIGVGKPIGMDLQRKGGNLEIQSGKLGTGLSKMIRGLHDET